MKLKKKKKQFLFLIYSEKNQQNTIIYIKGKQNLSKLYLIKICLVLL